MQIGVLALQGDFDAHRRRLQELGAEVVLVKKPEQLDDIDGLVIPGGRGAPGLAVFETWESIPPPPSSEGAEYCSPGCKSGVPT